jgi:hypothetical protein
MRASRINFQLIEKELNVCIDMLSQVDFTMSGTRRSLDPAKLLDTVVFWQRQLKDILRNQKRAVSNARRATKLEEERSAREMKRILKRNG